MKLGLVVEGHGEVQAAPAVVRRIAEELGVYDLDIPRPVRCKRSRLMPGHFEELERAVRLAASDGPDGVLVVIDADDDCPAQCAPLLLQRASAAAGGVPVAVVMANREFEAWFLAAVESLRGRRSVRGDATRPADPERPRDAKGHFERHCLEPGSYYSPTVDQPAYAATIDLDEARQHSASFDKLWRDLEVLLL